jgi:hypothetical protein
VLLRPHDQAIQSDSMIFNSSKDTKHTYSSSATFKNFTSAHKMSEAYTKQSYTSAHQGGVRDSRDHSTVHFQQKGGYMKVCPKTGATNGSIIPY